MKPEPLGMLRIPKVIEKNFKNILNCKMNYIKNIFDCPVVIFTFLKFVSFSQNLTKICFQKSFNPFKIQGLKDVKRILKHDFTGAYKN